jgi:hypothetical protein
VDEDGRRVRQVEIPSEQLEAGVYGPHNRLVPWGQIAILRPQADSLSKRTGIQFYDSHDDLGELKVALLELVPSATRLALTDHLHPTFPGTAVHGESELAAAADPASAAKDLLEHLVEALRLSPDEVIWRRTEWDR